MDHHCEELVSAAGQINGRGSLATFLSLPAEDVDALVASARAVLPEGEAFDEGDIELALGAMLIDNIANPEDEPLAYSDDLPSEVDLRDKMPKVRSQGGRGTCVAHAAAAVREYLIGDAGNDADLSEQFLYWVCKQRDGRPTGEGTYIKIAMRALKDLGVCPEQVWHYNPHPVVNDEGQGPPPANATSEAAAFRVKAVQELHARWVNTLKRVLAKGKPIAFSVPVFESWQRPYGYRVGDIRLPLPGEKVLGGHAMCMVGYVDDADVPGGGYFLVRNSWGEQFGYYGEVAPGYCRLPYEYVRRNGWEAFTAYTD